LGVDSAAAVVGGRLLDAEADALFTALKLDGETPRLAASGSFGTYWSMIKAKWTAGDWVMIQLGHNDNPVFTRRRPKPRRPQKIAPKSISRRSRPPGTTRCLT
jgi:hypothetical protein